MNHYMLKTVRDQKENHPDAPLAKGQLEFMTNVSSRGQDMGIVPRYEREMTPAQRNVGRLFCILNSLCIILSDTRGLAWFARSDSRAISGLFHNAALTTLAC